MCRGAFYCPVPVKLPRVCGLPEAPVTVTTMLVDFVPVLVGLNRTLAVQFRPAESVAGQVVVCKKSPGLVPPSATATGIAIVPVLVTVTVRTVVLVEPTVRLPKLKLPVFPETLKLGPRVPVNDAVCVAEPVAGTFRVALFAPAVPVGVKVTEIRRGAPEPVPMRTVAAAGDDGRDWSRSCR